VRAIVRMTQPPLPDGRGADRAAGGGAGGGGCGDVIGRVVWRGLRQARYRDRKGAEHEGLHEASGGAEHEQ
jgi:hypothetical protein